MSSDELSSYTPDDDEDDDETIVDDDEENSEEGLVKKSVPAVKRPVPDDDDDFESITGFGSKVVNKPHRRSTPGATPRSASLTRAADDEEESGEEEEEEVFKEPFTNTLVENGPEGLGMLDALQIAVVFEEMSDQLDIIGKSIDTPEIDLRSKASIDHDLAVNRPLITIPATFDPYSNSLFREKYILRQHYHTIAVRRIEQMCTRTPGTNLRRRLTAVLRDFGVNRYSEKGKVQSERTLLNIILDNVASELIQDFTFKSMVSAIDCEKKKYEGMKHKVEKSLRDVQDIADSRNLLKRLRVEKRKAKKEMQTKQWEFEDHRQELLKRKELEFLYVNHSALMTKARMKKMCTKAERDVMDDFDDAKLKREHCEYAHYFMLDIIYKKYKEAQRRLAYWVEKYEQDKETLQGELDQMKADRARDLLRIEWLKFMIGDYEQIAIDDRRMKKIADDRAKEIKLKNKKATKIQAWWRGEMYRKRLGPYNPKKQAKQSKKKK